MDLETKFDLILVELKKIFNQIENKFEQVDNKFEQIDKRFEQIDKRFEQIDKRFDGIDARITKFEEENKAEHKVMFDMLNTLNSAFLRFESEQNSKMKDLIEADKDRRDHQNIYAHEFTRLNDLVAKNSFRISNLEQHHQ